MTGEQSAEPAVVKKVEQELEYRVRTAVARYRAARLTSASTVVDEEVRQGRAAVRKILTPTPAAEPTSIADMAPGTRLVGRTRDGVLSTIDRTWIVTDDHHVFSTGAHLLVADRIDPSTIRDVTPPKAASVAVGDVPCPNDGELVNRRCWLCGWQPTRDVTPPTA